MTEYTVTELYLAERPAPKPIVLTWDGYTESIPDNRHIIDGLGRMNADTWLDQMALARTLGVTTRTVRRLVGRNEVPPGVKMGARRLWRVGAILAHVQARAEEAASKAAREQRRLDKWPDL
ncbi:MAG: hypothetical protein GC168_10020 [Candidatus Hydrogenedens sp.]|nr:hypothetical protein [Candidatus Hydrogenedens sp.]